MTPIKQKSMIIIHGKNHSILAGYGYDQEEALPFYRILGGSIEANESPLQCIHRELKEELNSDLLDVTLIDEIDNIFTYNGKAGHEHIYLYEGQLADKSLYDTPEIRILDNPNGKAHWVSVEDIITGKVRFFPDFDWKTFLTS